MTTSINSSLLEEKQVHIWSGNLDLSFEQLEFLFTLLSEDEKRRADKFYFPKDRSRFIAARGTLRKVLSRYLAIAPQQLQFDYAEHGKPFLRQEPSLQFNLSHAHTQILLAVTRASAVGVDIEYAAKEIDSDGIAARFFSSTEYEIIKDLSGVAKREAFFNGWVRKEAFLKALGAGLSYSLAKVEVSLLPHQPTCIIALPLTEDINAWSLVALDAPPDYKAALVVRAKDFAIKNFKIEAEELSFT